MWRRGILPPNTAVSQAEARFRNPISRTLSPDTEDDPRMPSLSDFLKQLSPDEVVEIVESADLDYFPTALVLELEKRRRARARDARRSHDGPARPLPPPAHLA